MKTHPKTKLVSYSLAALSLFTRGALIAGRRAEGRIPVRNHGAIAVLLSLVVGAARLASAQYDPSAQFSPVANPNGVWTYGYETVPLGVPTPFNLLTLALPVASVPGPFINSWQSPAFGTLGVFDNGTPVPQSVTIGPETSLFNSGELAMHAGPNDEYGMVQFSAPANGIYTIQGTFEGIDVAGTSSTVFLLHNNTVVASSIVIPFGPPVPLASGPFLLNVGDTLAFAVGGGPFNSMTALVNAQVAAVGVPEPSPYALLGLAIVPLAVRGFARKGKPVIA